MKKTPMAPVVRKVEFAYNEQVVASTLPEYYNCEYSLKGRVTWGQCEVVSMSGFER